MKDEGTNGLVQIGKMSRRSFLKGLGTASAVGLASCADPSKQKILPNVRGEEDQIPGVSVWYRSTCTECSSGCGITVRTREGRAVKIEGSPDSPINQGSLCGLGQSALQALYDPDRIRQPLERTSMPGEKPVFKPIAWEDALTKVATALKKSSGKGTFITGEVSGTYAGLVESFSKGFGFEHVVYDPLQPVAVARASELVYGTYGIPQYHLDRAEVVLNFGADFLETWVSPTTYARQWAEGRRKKPATKVIHIEPRLSLTAANADMTICPNPGSEVRIGLAVLKLLLENIKSGTFKDELKSQVEGLVKNIKIKSVSEESGVPEDKILKIARALQEAGSSLVLAGGASGSGANGLGLAVMASLMNLVLGNVGNTVDLSAMRVPQTSLSKLASAVSKMNAGERRVVFVHGTNPVFTLPSDYGLQYGLRKVSVQKDGSDRVGLVVSLSTHLDETAQEADIILPTNHSLEDWGDAAPLPGVYGLIQPAMTPIFDTRGAGDLVLDLAKRGGQESIAKGAADFLAYLKTAWGELHNRVGGGLSFAKWWRERAEQGGYFASSSGDSSDKGKGRIDPDALRVDFGMPQEARASNRDDLALFPYASTTSFDGRAANRPWLQELPDPVTKIVWDAWAEIHPATATRLGIAQGDLVTVRSDLGEVNVPAYLTEYVHQGIVAIPLGQGHTAYGRYATQVSGVGNVFSLVPKQTNGNLSAGLAYSGARVKVMKGPGRAKLVNTQGSDSQFGRGLALSTVVGAEENAHASEHEHAHSEHEHGEGHGHEPKQMYEQREHPMYHWGMVVDLAACTGCSACVVACYAENNIPMVGKELCWQGREMSWLRIERYYEGPAEELQVNFLPMMCQHCGNAPCEPVCPVYATYHNEEGMNVMAYNRCVGTRYCSNNCSYKVRRFNWFEYDFPEPLNLQLNPDVTKRSEGVMEKCTFCIQRIAEAKDHAKDLGRMVEDGEVQPACVQGCPTKALTFGNLNDPKSAVAHKAKDARAYKVLDHHLNTQPSITYLKGLKYEV